MTKDQFSFNDIPDLSGKIAIVTGSNTGIGKVCARELARKNCHVIVACRNKEKGLGAVQDIKENVGSKASIEFVELDLMSLASVKAFVSEFEAKHDRLDILLNNAGIMMTPFGLSEDGIEQQFATNHVGPFYLTQCLLPLLEKSSPSRIVNVSSSGHNFTSLSGINYDTINSPKCYSPTLQYGKTKAANILFTRELTKRLQIKGVKIYVNANHPGAVDTELQRYSLPNPVINKLFKKMLCFYSADDGALTQLYLATSEDIETKNISGQYYVPIAKSSKPNAFSQSDKNALELWNFTEKLLKEKISDYPGSILQ